MIIDVNALYPFDQLDSDVRVLAMVLAAERGVPGPVKHCLIATADASVAFDCRPSGQVVARAVA